MNKQEKNELGVLKEATKDYIEEGILELDDWEVPLTEKYPPVHVATLSGKKLYARKMTVKDKSTIAKVLVLNKNETDFTIFSKIIGVLALDENGNQFFKTSSQKEKIIERDYDTIMKLYLKILSVADEETYKSLTEEDTKED